MTIRKAILLAGGSGTRLQPLTDYCCKQLLPLYDKPVIYYPLATLMQLGIRDILIISTPRDTPVLEQALGDGSHLGLTLSYAVQERPGGIAEAFVIAADFIAGAPVALMLGDNILHTENLAQTLGPGVALDTGACIIGIPSMEPQRFGVIEHDADGRVLSIVEKPDKPKSDMAAIGLYFYDGTVARRARTLRPSARGELEITDLNNLYLADGQLRCVFLTRGSTWLDAGTFDSIMDAGVYLKIVERHLGLKIGCVEEIAYLNNYITRDALLALAAKYSKSPYGAYLKKVADKP